MYNAEFYDKVLPVMNLGSGSSNSQQSQKSFQPSFGESGNSTPRGDHEEE